MSLISVQLPVRLTPLVGRESELSDIVQAVTRCRLLTLTGPGGAGKTRLALAAARSAGASFPAGVCWVELAQIEDPGIVAQAVATRLGVPDTPGQDVTEAVADYLGEHQVLVVLDNCEHLADATAGLTENLLAACLALVICERRVAGTCPDGEQIRLSGRGCAVVRLQPDGAWRIAADAWETGPELPAGDWPSRWPDRGTMVRSD